ncbi:interleukin-1 receptor accessory protein-like 1-B [Schistocerca gregaria]|uniref:interleukin-1 receptor accessory protein-like 1-B n=1 Tax=Schistocerca gregaria TaxID=7010 RepID=UPI00211EFBE0|nr:interleukin-1 receptor accessory protein-like 1-B [Schistocerca gregaria]
MRHKEPALPLLLLLLLGFGARARASRLGSFCEHLIAPDPSPPTISAELNSVDTAYLTKYKSLHCCARDYDSIEWYKDGEPLSPKHSTFSISAVDQNQTIESTYVQDADKGNYTCVVTNSTQPEPKTFTISLVTKYMNCTSRRPMITRYPANQYALPGESAQFYCEALVGCGEVAKTAHVYWALADQPLRFVKSARDVVISDVQRDNYSIKGSFLIFKKVTVEDYGHYTCHIDNNIPEPCNFNVSLIYGVDPDAKVIHTYKTTVIIVCVFIGVTTLTIMFVIQWHLELRLFWKNRFGKSEENDDKEYDVFVCYDEQDSDFALDVLVATLETSYGYKCFAFQRDSLAGDWIPETYANAVKKSRRFLMVLSSALAANNWCIYALYIAIEALLNLHSKIICVELQNICWDVTLSNTNINDTTLRHVLNVIKKIRWKPGCTPLGVSPDDVSLHGMELYGKGSQEFWKRLRLHLPPRRMLHNAANHEILQPNFSPQASTLTLINHSA